MSNQTKQKNLHIPLKIKCKKGIIISRSCIFKVAIIQIDKLKTFFFHLPKRICLLDTGSAFQIQKKNSIE